MLRKYYAYLPFLLGIAILVALYGLLARVWYEVSSGVLHNDALIFQTVGRGYLNGYLPYQDLFETKPPGIFLIHALSWKLFQSQFLVKVLQAIVLLGIPILTTLPVLSLIEDRSIPERKVSSLLTILFGLLLALFTANQAGEGLTESYGACAVLAYFALLQIGKPKVVLMGLLLLIAAGLKEPFLLIVVAGVVLLCDRRSYTQNFLIPLGIAIALGFIGLLATGIAGPFFQVYLPHMLTFHIHQHDTPLYLRMFEVWRVFVNMGAYSWWFSGGVIVVIVSVCLRSIGHRLLVMRYGISVLLVLLAIAIGGDFYGHHFVFAVPVYAILWWKYLKEFGPRFGYVVIMLFACSALFDTRFTYADSTESWKQKETELRSVAVTMDTVMERCGYDRYLQMVVRGYGPYPYTKASPYGPIFVHYARFIGRTQEYSNAHIRALQETPLVLLYDIENSNLTDFAKQYFGATFSEDAPACAGEDYQGIEPYHLLFRQE